MAPVLTVTLPSAISAPPDQGIPQPGERKRKQ